ncbi:hypothetical protein N015_08065 [Pseudomonas asturiensis]|uniref:Uncharacterized protein n=1 Tax=Pseudomonas asturiensis TaxID=1190415 RepID=A0ABX6HA29_9PSED|nr:hypothetical protein [Pseudomonas asturiensis]QHF02370.1 hypothetical protein N015_08065 [Pseudomonas asturiensis]
MRNPQKSKGILVVLLLVCLAQAAWILMSSPPSPTLSRVVSTYPVGRDGMLYKVVSDTGGATEPFSYRYYIFQRIDDSKVALKKLRDEGSAFLVTRDGDAKVDIRGAVVKISVSKAVYSFHSSTLFRHEGSYTPVTIQLEALTSE